MSRIIDPEIGETLYRVGLYNGKKEKVMRSAGAWLKVYEDAADPKSVNQLTYFITTGES